MYVVVFLQVEGSGEIQAGILRLICGRERQPLSQLRAGKVDAEAQIIAGFGEASPSEEEAGCRMEVAEVVLEVVGRVARLFGFHPLFAMFDTFDGVNTHRLLDNEAGG